MTKKNTLTLARLNETLRRQDPPQWGSAYEPAIRATRDEAPARSRPSQVWSSKLERYCHVLSLVEQKALILALFHPALFEFHEQRMLTTEARPHPLVGHERVIGLELPGLRGTIDVCDRLDMISRHPCIHVQHPDGIGKVPVPTPFIGDLLLFLVDQDGPYCVNWTIKGAADDFQRPLLGDKPSKNATADAMVVRARHAIEERYYLDADIRTVRIVDRDIPELFNQNLRSLILMQNRAVSIDDAVYVEVCDRLQASMQTGQPPMDVLISVMHRYDIPMETAKTIFYRAIWQRDVRPELMEEVIFIDRPLKPERKDPLQVFGSWFSRTKS